MLGGGSLRGYGWIIEGKGIVFTNYGHGDPGTITNQVMLGADSSFGSGIVKIVQPDTFKADKGKLTVIGRDEGRLLLLREGWLRKNALSREIRSEFAFLSELSPVPVTVSGVTSKRQWFVVADLSASPAEIVEQTATFALACANARLRAGGGKTEAAKEEPYSLGMDEKGRVVLVERHGRNSEVCALQGYVWEALKQQIGEKLTKPTRGGFAVDGMIKAANLLIEIKTGIVAHDLYEAVGQLKLYPFLIGLDPGLEPVMLLPDTDPLKPDMAAALDAATVKIYTYSVGRGSRKPVITFSEKFLKRCKMQIPEA